MPSTYAFYICRLADGKAPESIYHYICGQNPCQVEAENSAPYIWHLGQSHKVHVMLGLRVLANPDDFMEVSGIFGHDPLCETEPVLSRGSIDYVTYGMEEHYRRDRRGGAEHAGGRQ